MNSSDDVIVTIETIRQYIQNLAKGTPIAKALSELLQDMDNQGYFSGEDWRKTCLETSLEYVTQMAIEPRIFFPITPSTNKVGIVLTVKPKYYLKYYFTAEQEELKKKIYAQYNNPDSSLYAAKTTFLIFEVNPEDEEPGATPVIMLQDLETRTYFQVDFVPTDQAPFKQIIDEMVVIFEKNTVIFNKDVFRRTLKNRVKF